MIILSEQTWTRVTIKPEGFAQKKRWILELQKNTYLPCTSASVPWIWTPLWSRIWESDLGYISFDSASVFINFLFCRYAFHHDSLVLRGNLRSKTVLQHRHVSSWCVKRSVHISLPLAFLSFNDSSLLRCAVSPGPMCSTHHGCGEEREITRELGLNGGGGDYMVSWLLFIYIFLKD